MVSIKATRQRIILLLAAVAAVIAMTSAAFSADADVKTGTSGGMEISRSVSDDNDVVEFLRAYGWEVESQPAETKEVQIPSPFDSVYEQYNALQREQGFDLSPYRGRTVKVESYRVLNYPEYEDESDMIHATVIIYKEKIIGGDISSVEFGGFMHGFDMETVQSEKNSDE